MKILIAPFVVVFFLASAAYSQPTSLVFHSPDFATKIKKPENIEQAKDTFQGIWAINLKSETGEVVDTVIVDVRMYSTRNPNLIIFSSVGANSVAKEISPTKVMFYQSGENSTIEFKTSDNAVVKFDGSLNPDLSIDAKAVKWTSTQNFSGYTLEAARIADDLGSTWVCGNDDNKPPGAPLHGRHATRSSIEMKSLTQTNQCTNWRKWHEGEQ